MRLQSNASPVWKNNVFCVPTIEATTSATDADDDDDDDDDADDDDAVFHSWTRFWWWKPAVPRVKLMRRKNMVRRRLQNK